MMLRSGAGAGYAVKNKIAQSIVFVVLALGGIGSGCATVEQTGAYQHRTSDILSGYPQSRDPLKLQRITSTPISIDPASTGNGEVFIIVHPAYSAFFRDPAKDRYSEAKDLMVRKQFDNETSAITAQAASGKLVVLVLPGKYAEDSHSPLSYISYLNSLMADGRQLYYVLSDTSSAGSLPMNDMVSLYSFITVNKAKKVMIGGGYIGRCQREFYNQLTTYLDKSFAYVVPEMSVVSPDDVSEEEALTIASSVTMHDFSPVRAFIDKKTGGKANILSIPPKQDL